MKSSNVTLMLAFCVSLCSCKKDDDDPKDVQPPINEPEQITTVELHFENHEAGTHFHAVWTDPDGAGGEEPTMDSILLDVGSSYDVEVRFIDASSETPTELTAEINEEGDEHMVCFEGKSTEVENAISIEKTDSDGNLPIGLTSKWTVQSAAEGLLNLTLKHQPDGEKDGTCTPGDTDVDIDFPIRTQ